MNSNSVYDTLLGRAEVLLPPDVPGEKRDEFSRGFLRYLDEKHPELFALLKGGAVFTNSDRSRLQHQIAEFHSMVRKAKGVSDENA